MHSHALIPPPRYEADRSWQEHLVRGHPYIRSQSAKRRSERGRQATIPPSQSAHQASYPSLEPVSCTGVTRDRSTSSCPSGLCASRPARCTLSFGARRSLYPAAPGRSPLASGGRGGSRLNWPPPLHTPRVQPWRSFPHCISLATAWATAMHHRRLLFSSGILHPYSRISPVLARH